MIKALIFIVILLSINSCFFSKGNFYKYPNVKFPDVYVVVNLNSNPFFLGERKAEIHEIRLKDLEVFRIDKMNYQKAGGLPLIYSNNNYDIEKIKGLSLNWEYNRKRTKERPKLELKKYKSHFTSQYIYYGLDETNIPLTDSTFLSWKEESTRDKNNRRPILTKLNIKNNNIDTLFLPAYKFSWYECNRIDLNANLLLFILHMRPYKENIFMYFFDLENNIVEKKIKNPEIKCSKYSGLDMYNNKYFCYTNPNFNEHGNISTKIEIVDFNTMETIDEVLEEEGSLSNPRVLDEEWIIYQWGEIADLFFNIELRLYNFRTKKEYVLIRSSGNENKNISFDILR